VRDRTLTSTVLRRALQTLIPGAILTLTYYGAEKVFPNYNIMGVAKAALVMPKVAAVNALRREESAVCGPAIGS